MNIQEFLPATKSFTHLRAVLIRDDESGTTGVRLGSGEGGVSLDDDERELLNGDSYTKPISCRADFSDNLFSSATIPSRASIQLRLMPEVMADSTYSPSSVYSTRDQQ